MEGLSRNERKATSPTEHPTSQVTRSGRRRLTELTGSMTRSMTEGQCKKILKCFEGKRTEIKVYYPLCLRNL